MRKNEFTRERGAAAVEFALVLVVLVPMLAGVIDYSLLGQARRSVADATPLSGPLGRTSLYRERELHGWQPQRRGQHGLSGDPQCARGKRVAGIQIDNFQVVVC